MPAPITPFNIGDLPDLLAQWPISQGETRRLQDLIGDLLVDAYENSGTDLDPESFRLMLPASLLRLLVELLAPIADHPHPSTELDLTLHVLKALTDRLNA
nr:hypothetical protein OG781_42395 [Streptomyces sp. NBC_00830]